MTYSSSNIDTYNYCTWLKWLSANFPCQCRWCIHVRNRFSVNPLFLRNLIMIKKNSLHCLRSNWNFINSNCFSNFDCLAVDINVCDRRNAYNPGRFRVDMVSHLSIFSFFQIMFLRPNTQICVFPTSLPILIF